ncbi:MAG: DNA-protecting protein DprA [Chlorobiaceae bacterium]|nr:DNA-protecting protein DprA [Chlorobiaceae bacterium]
MSVLPPERGRELLLLILSQIPGIGPARTNAIIARFGPDPAMLDADAPIFAETPGIGARLAADIVASFASKSWMARALDAANRQLELAAGLGATILSILDPRYPELLKEIYDPPPLLFVRGNPSALALPSVAIVGTRKASAYGRQVAEQFSRDLVLDGYAVVSGLAYGIDMTAHRAAIDSGGTTCAVLGCGIDTIYTDPAGRLWPKMLERGAIISEEWIGTGPAPGNFPRRNRLISGISAGTLVVESDITGGSMITASCAIEQNREVFAVPGSIFSSNSRGTNILIQRCHAKPVLDARDIVAELGPTAATPLLRSTRHSEDARPIELSREESVILDLLGEEAVHIDTIAEATGMPVAALLVHLFELEMKRAIVQESGQLFRTRRPSP